MNWTLLHKYLTGECSPNEKQKVEHWINSDERNQSFFDSIVRIWSVEPDDHIKVDAERVWNTFKKKLLEVEGSKSQNVKGRINTLQSRALRRKGYSRSIAISIAAAAIAVAAVLTYVFLPNLFFINGQQEKTQVQEISTAMGQRTSFRMADGSQVYLNADSRVVIPPSFGDTVRSIQLEGEAYFDVNHDSGSSFIVQSGRSRTKVLGTKFGVKAYPGEGKVRVVVEEGKVEMSSSDKATEANTRELTNNQMGLLDSNGTIAVKTIEELASYLAWKEGRLVFESTPFGEAVPLLERWYNIEIEAARSLTSQQVTASFDDEPMLEVLNILALSLDADFQREGRNITFNPK